MREKLKKWIVALIKDTYPVIPKQEQVDYSLVENYIKNHVEDILKQYQINGECMNCSKVIIGHYGGFYRNFKGQLFCSSNCIDLCKE